MAKLLHPAEPVRFEPFDQKARPEADQVAFLLKAPTVYDRALLQSAIRRAGGREWSDAQQIACLRAGIEATLGDAADAAEAKASLLAQIDAVESDTREIAAEVMDGRLAEPDEEGARNFVQRLRANAAMRAELQPILDAVEAGYPRLANMLADAETYPIILGIEAARLFLVGWENLRFEGAAVEFARDRQRGVPPELLNRIKGPHLTAIGYEVLRLMSPTETEKKISGSPSPGPSDETTSPAENGTT